MPTIVPAPFTLANALLTIGTDDYQKAVSSVEFTPSSSTLEWKGLTPDAVYTDATNASWVCKISYAQDWSTTNSLSQYLLTNAATQKVCVFKPKGATTGFPMFTATLIIQPGAIGGDGNVQLVAEVTLGVVGAPVKSTVP